MGTIRSIARGVAKNRMVQKGYMQFCKPEGKGGDSAFSKMWRKEVGWNAGSKKVR